MLLRLFAWTALRLNCTDSIHSRPSYKPTSHTNSRYYAVGILGLACAIKQALLNSKSACKEIRGIALDDMKAAVEQSLQASAVFEQMYSQRAWAQIQSSY